MSFQFLKSFALENAAFNRATHIRPDSVSNWHTPGTIADIPVWGLAPEQKGAFDGAESGDMPLLKLLARLQERQSTETTDSDSALQTDEFVFETAPPAPSELAAIEDDRGVASLTNDQDSLVFSATVGRPDDPLDPPPDTGSQIDIDPDPAPAPVPPTVGPPEPTQFGRPEGSTPGTPTNGPQGPAPSGENAESGRPADATPDVPPPGTGPLTTYTSGGPAASSYNVTIDFVGTWTTELQASFIDAADYLSTMILSDLPDVVVDGAAIDDIVITATLEAIDGVGGILGSAGPRDLRGDGTFLPSTGAMRFDSEDAQNQLNLGNWETIILHEMMHAMGFGTLWSLMGLTSGSVAGGDIRFTGQNAIDVYNSEFPGIAGSDSGSLLGVPVETDGGPGTAGGHWDEVLFQDEIMTGFVDQGAFVSLMTIASFEDMGYDTVFDNPYSPTDLFAPIPTDPLSDLFA
ncbi:MAG: leishmanolysin-related zinc metalloendopeptidase [Roseovarius sp.]